MPEGIYKFSYSTTIQAGLLGQDFTTQGSGILVFQANQIIGFVNEGKKERQLEGNYIIEPAKKRPRKNEEFNCKIWAQRPIPGTFGEQCESEEEKNFKLEMTFCSETEIHGTHCIAIIPRGEVNFELKFSLGFQCQLKLAEEETQ